MKRKHVMIRIILSVFVATLIMSPLAVLAAEPVPFDQFIEITKDVLVTFEVLEKDARNGDFNHLRNSGVRETFDEIRDGLTQYERYVVASVKNWPEGQQKEIASELHEVNFLYRAYSLSESNKFREQAENSLHKTRELYRDYVRHAKAGE
jgi:hypothetical protein